MTQLNIFTFGEELTPAAIFIIIAIFIFLLFSYTRIKIIRKKYSEKEIEPLLKTKDDIPICILDFSKNNSHIMLFNIFDTFFVRQSRNNDDTSVDIWIFFLTEELEQVGIKGEEIKIEEIQRGGCEIEIHNTQKTITLTGKSRRYGECNKQIVADIIKKTYPGFEIIKK